MLKVMTVLGTRPEIIKLSLVISQLDRFCRHVLVHTGQNYDFELNEIFFEEMGIRRPDYFLGAVGKGPAETIGNIIARSAELFESERPDALLVYGDTNSCLCVISAKRYKIPIFHMEAGNRCFDLRVPEELNRKVVDHLSDVNMTLTEHARRYLLREGLPPELTMKIGSSMLEVLTHHADSIRRSAIVERLKLTPNEYFVVSAHREENIDNPENFKNLVFSLNTVAQRFGKRIIFSSHPRTMKKLSHHTALSLDPLVEVMKPLGFFDYISLQTHAYCVISDSGTITEESSLLGFPAITIRQAHERPEGMDVGVLIMSGLDPESVVDSINIVVATHSPTRQSVPDYGAEDLSIRVVKIIQSYTSYIRRTVWREA